MSIISTIKELFVADEVEIRIKAKAEAVRRFNIERIKYREIWFDVVTFDGVPVSMPNKAEEENLVNRLCEYRDMFVAMSVEKMEIL